MGLVALRIHGIAHPVAGHQRQRADGGTVIRSSIPNPRTLRLWTKKGMSLDLIYIFYRSND